MPKKTKKNQAPTGPLQSRECVIIMPDIEIKLPKGETMTRKHFDGFFREEVDAFYKKLVAKIASYHVATPDPRKERKSKVKVVGKPVFDIYI